jgi:hypothetical protein
MLSTNIAICIRVTNNFRIYGGKRKHKLFLVYFPSRGKRGL